MALAPTTASVATDLASLPIVTGYAKSSVSGYNVSTVDVTVSALQTTVAPNKYYNYTIVDQIAWQAEGAPAISATDYLFSQVGLTTTQKTAGTVAVSTQNGPGATPTAANNMIVLASDATHVLLGYFSQGNGTYQTYYLISNTTQNSAVSADFPAGATLTYSNTSFPTLAAFTSTFSPACYQAGTCLRTEHGETAVEDLRVGDLMAVLEGSQIVMKPVIWIGHRRIEIASLAEPALALPIRIKRDAFAEGMPVRDLLVSPDHAIFVDGVLIPAKLLVNGGSIAQDASFQRVHYFHVELEQHGVLLAEGLPAESFLDCGNRHSFENSGNTIALRPEIVLDRDVAGAAHAFCHRMAEDVATVRPVWVRLAERSAELGFAAPAPVTTTDPGLLVLAAGRELKPVSCDDGRFVFVLPAGATDVSLVSRSATPGELQPWLADRRRLGVAIGRIGLRSGDEWTDIALDGPDLGRGWWAMEQSGRKAWRWTNGRACLAMPEGGSADRMLEVQVTSGMEYVLEAGLDDAFLRAA